MNDSSTGDCWGGRLIEVAGPTGPKAYACCVQIKEAEGQRAVFRTERPVFVSMSNDNMGRPPADAVISFIPGSNNSRKSHGFRLFRSVLDGPPDRVDNHAAQTPDLCRVFHHYPVPGLLVFGRWGGTGNLQELFQDCSWHTLFLKGPDRPSPAQKLFRLLLCHCQFLLDRSAPVWVKPVEAHGACGAYGYAMTTPQAKIRKIERGTWIVLLGIHLDDLGWAFCHTDSVLFTLLLIHSDESQYSRLHIIG